MESAHLIGPFNNLSHDIWDKHQYNIFVLKNFPQNMYHYLITISEILDTSRSSLICSDKPPISEYETSPGSSCDIL